MCPDFLFLKFWSKDNSNKIASVAHSRTHKNELYESAIPHFGSTLNFGLASPFCVLTEIWFFFFYKRRKFQSRYDSINVLQQTIQTFFDIKGYLELQNCPGKQIWIWPEPKLYSQYSSVAHGWMRKNELYMRTNLHICAIAYLGLAPPFCLFLFVIFS